MPGDRERSGQRKVQAILDGADRSWMKHKTCELCGVEITVNNYPDRRSRTPKVLKRVCCPWCEHRKGKRRMAEKIIVERLASLGTEWPNRDRDKKIAHLMVLAQKVQEL